MRPTVSVVIPAYNAKRFLKDALDSALRQSHPPTEVLVIDDGSSDGTGLLAASVTGIRRIRQPNAGVSAARNRGIEEATGRFIAFLDADDVWEPNKLATQLEELSEDQFACSARTETNERPDPTRIVQGIRRVSLLESLLFEGNVVGTPSSVIAPRSALLAAGGFDPRLSMCADWDMWIRLALRVSSRYSEEPMVRYRVHGESMSANVRMYESDSLYMLRKTFDLALPSGLLARRAEAGARMWEVLGGCYSSQGAVADAIRCATQSIRRRPSRLVALAISVPHRMFRRAVGRPR